MGTDVDWMLEDTEYPSCPPSSSTTAPPLWLIGDVHPIYGEVQMMGVLDGEPYRWFSKDNVVSMIPLAFC